MQQQARSSVRRVLATPGRPLDAPARAFYESRFAHDFSRVRVHDDDRAHVVQQSTSAPRVQRLVGAVAGIVAGIGALAYGIYRLLSDSFSATELRRYLAWIRQTKRTQDEYDSDNKARACVRREQELGPYSLEDRVLLIKEMLSGVTLGADEEAILMAMRNAPPGQAALIVTRIGRERLWSNFSGRNRRILEAITLTAADAGEPLVARLRDLDPNAIQDYVRNAVDPAVQRSATRAAQLRTFTAPVPDRGTFIAPQTQGGNARFVINGVEVVVHPDAESAQYDKGDGATSMRLVAADFGSLNPFRPPRLQADVRTVYGTGTDTSGEVKYGRGTTDADKLAGRKSHRFHESRHGQDWFDFLATNAPPPFTGHAGMTQDEFGRALQTYGEALNDYNCRALEFSIRRSDCVGKAADERHVRHERGPCPIEATICKQ